MASLPPSCSWLRGTNERISVANHAELIRFYHRLLLNAAGKPEEMK